MHIVCLFVCFCTVFYFFFFLGGGGGWGEGSVFVLRIYFALWIIITIKLQSGGLLVAYLLTFQSHPNTHKNSLFFIGYPATSGKRPVCRNKVEYKEYNF